MLLTIQSNLANSHWVHYSICQYSILPSTVWEVCPAAGHWAETLREESGQVWDRFFTTRPFRLLSFFASEFLLLMHWCCFSIANSYPTLWDPMDCSMSGSSVLYCIPWVGSNSCPLSQWCYLTMSYSAASFSFCLQPFPTSQSLPISQLFAPSGQSIRASALPSVPPMNSQSWFL